MNVTAEGVASRLALSSHTVDFGERVVREEADTLIEPLRSSGKEGKGVKKEGREGGQ